MSLTAVLVIGAGVAATVVDIRQRRVPNVLTMGLASVGLAFGLAGAGLGGLGVWAVRAAGGIPATSDLLNFLFSGPALMPTLGGGSVAISIVVVVVVSVLSGFYPALLAMRVTPVEAMATED